MKYLSSNKMKLTQNLFCFFVISALLASNFSSPLNAQVTNDMSIQEKLIQLQPSATPSGIETKKSSSSASPAPSMPDMPPTPNWFNWLSGLISILGVGAVVRYRDRLKANAWRIKDAYWRFTRGKEIKKTKQILHQYISNHQPNEKDKQ
jgi:hypothetical protein